MKKELKEKIIADIEVRSGKKCNSFFADFIKMYFNFGETIFRFTFWYRMRQFYKVYNPIGLISFFMYYVIYKNIFDIKIPNEPDTYIGKGLHIVHGSNVYLNAQSIGDYLKVYQGVTLGTNKKEERPIIGNNVTIYTNAVVCGNIRIGDNCVIGANTFVNEDVLDNSTVIAKGQIVKKKNK